MTSRFWTSLGMDLRVEISRCLSCAETITIESPGERLEQIMGIPVLLLAYKRPQNTLEITNLISDSSTIYLFVDRDQNPSKLNDSVINLAQEFFSSATRKAQIQPIHLGPGVAMLRALDWVFQFEEIVLILEDDVFPNEHAARYWDSVKNDLLSTSLLVTSRSPFQDRKFANSLKSGYSKFALTNGWILTRQIWEKFQTHQRHSLLAEFSKFIVKNPLGVRTEHFFFLASAMLGRRGIVQAWDSQFIFFTLLNKIKTITPNNSCVEIRGVDAVASNTIVDLTTIDEIFWKADGAPPANYLPNDKKINAIYDKEIKLNIYGVRWWHLFSPLKSLLRILKSQRVNFYKP